MRKFIVALCALGLSFAAQALEIENSTTGSSSKAEAQVVETHETCGACHGSEKLGDKKGPSCDGRGYHVKYVKK